MRRSRIFTNRELDEIEQQKIGNWRDKTGIFNSRVRPKIRELLNIWFPRKKELEQLEKSKRKRNDEHG